MRSPNTSIAREGRKERYGLNGLTQTHLVSQYPVQPLIVESDEPIKTDDLIFSQRPVQEERNLCKHIRRLQVNPDRLKSLRHFDSHIGDVRDLLVPLRLSRLRFLFLKPRLRIIDLDLLSQGLLVRDDGPRRVLVHALLDEALGVELLSDTD